MTPVTKSIFLCASMAFYRSLLDIEKQLTQKGFIVHIPISAQSMKERNDFEISHFKDAYPLKQKGEFIHQNFETIAGSDCILVINDEKNGKHGYIGTNVLMEIAIAFYFKKKIYILNFIEKDAPYTEELSAFGVEYINKDLQKIL